MENGKKKFFKRKSFWVIVIVIIIGFAALSGGDDSSSENKEVKSDVSSTKDTSSKEDISSEKDASSEKDTSSKEDASSEEDTSLEEDTSDTSDEFTPAYICSKLQENDAYPYELSEKADKFLTENPKFFPVKKKAKIKKYIDYSIDYRHLTKNSSKYGDKLMAIEGAYVISCKEENITDDMVITELQLNDSEGNNFMVLYFGELEDVLEDDTVNCYGLPLGTTSFENVSGGTTLAGVMAGSYIEKIN